MARKRARISETMLFTWLVLISVILFLCPQSISDKFHFAFVRVFKPVLSTGGDISRSAMARPETVSRSKYVKLENHAANLLAELHEVQRGYEQIAGLRARFALENAAFILADVITISTDALKHELVINRGRIDSVAVGQFVLSDNSVVGVVEGVSHDTARVRLITDPGCKLHVKVAVSDAYIHGIMQGDGTRQTEIKMKYKANSGDKVYVCKHPGAMDTPIIAGEVTDCRRADDNPLLWDISVEPVSDIEALENVAVIVMNPQPDAAGK